MSWYAMLLLAVGLAMDATAVAAARGVSAPKVTPANVIVIAVLFGGLQALMPMLGAGVALFVGRSAGALLESIDHWIAFVVLVGLGAKMLVDARGGDDGNDDDDSSAVPRDAFRLRVLVALALATSIDALAVGFTLPLLHADLALSFVVIGMTTAVLSAAGVIVGGFLGTHLGAWLKNRLEAVGGLVLCVIGLHILVEHTLLG
jgi:putative Mn2+ efflux pump MntP